MKKFFISAFMILFGTCAVFAAKPELNIDFNFAVPALFNLKASDDSRKLDLTTSLGADADFQIFFTPYIGAFIETEFYFPVNRLLIDEDKNRSTQSPSDFTSWWGFSTLIGPAFRAINFNRWSAVVAPGFSLRTQEMQRDSYKAVTYLTGAGVNLGVRFKLNKFIYLRAGQEIDLYFHKWVKEEFSDSTKDTDAKTLFLNATESIGFGFIF